MFRSPPCLLLSPILSPPCSLPPSLPTPRAPAPSSSSHICSRRASVRMPRPMFRGSPTATVCRQPTRSTQKTSIRRTSSSSKLPPSDQPLIAKTKKKRLIGWLLVPHQPWGATYMQQCAVDGMFVLVGVVLLRADSLNVCTKLQQCIADSRASVSRHRKKRLTQERWWFLF